MFAARSFRCFAPMTTSRAPVTARQLQTSSRLRLPNKDSQDKDSMKIESNEYSKSGSDQAAAKDGDAFDPSKTKPESEGGDSSNSMDVSPQNHDVSKPKKGSDGESGSPRQSGQGPTDRSKSSGGGSPKKSG